jgi:PTS system galactitol-specific IIB component
MTRRKRVIVACGTAIATSTHVADRLAREFAARGIDAAITQCRVTEIAAYVDDADVVVTTALATRDYPIPVVSGIPFLTGVGEEAALTQVLEALGEERGVSQ